jgi:hypothetical protein
MAIESRSRMISFRLTDEEYDRFRNVCIALGLRNVSELVRNAVNQLVEGQIASVPAVPPAAILDRMATLESRVGILASALAKMESRLTPTHLNHSDPVHLAQANGQ